MKSSFAPPRRFAVRISRGIVARGVLALLTLAAASITVIQAAAAQQPFYHNASPKKQGQPPNSPSIFIDLKGAPPANTIDGANDRFDARAAAAVYAMAAMDPDAQPFNSDGYGVVILSMFALQDYFAIPTADNHRDRAIASLRNQVAGKTGTDGDYDFLLNLYIPLLYKYYDGLGSIDDKPPVREHIVNDLLNVRGPLTKHESDHIHNAFAFVPETENHLFLIETARYLTNQLLYQRTHDRQFDNRRNGDGSDPPATVVWILNALQGVLKNDFVEYNARSYQDEIMKAALNLASYAYDDDVRLAAGMVLDYISAKIAVSSNDLRREPPFRRRNEVQNWGPFKTNDLVLRSPLLVSNIYPDIDPKQVYSPDPQGTWYAILAGNTQLLNGSALAVGPGNFSLAMVTAGLHDYRVPAPILDLFVSNSSRRFYQRFHHEHVIQDTELRDTADELYAASPSFLISAGGHPTNSAYKPVVLTGILDSPIGGDADRGLAMPTTFMPTAPFGPVELTLDRYIQIGLLSGGSGSDKYNMCVAPNFACGCSIYLPPQFDPDKTSERP